MSRLGITLGLVALVTSGCVPVNNPIGDIDKAEPDKAMLGDWTTDGGQRWTVDCPEVKGNPKGLMRLRAVTLKDGKPGQPDAEVWFFTTKTAKFTYSNALIELKDGRIYADLSRDGAYDAWRVAQGAAVLGRPTRT